MIDHDRIFKELIKTFFLEFIELFFGLNPQCRADQRTEHLIGHMPKL